MDKKLKIGLFGFGCVGQGLYDILCNNDHFNSEVVKICVKNPDKPRSLPKDRFVYHRDDILQDENIDLIVELISDAGEALRIARTAIASGKTVISANKKMIAENFSELYRLQKESGGVLLYEAACCGSIPIIRNLEEYYDNEPLQSVSGIFNGSSNFILSKIFNENLSYGDALKQAQELGFAEADPTLDVSGRDAANKLSIIIAHAFGLVIHPDKIAALGIQNIQQADVDLAVKNGLKIKSIARAHSTPGGALIYYVIPAFIAANDDRFYVENELNTVVVNGRFSGRQQFTGKGAGGHPTGSAVLSDISASLYSYKYGYKKLQYAPEFQPAADEQIDVYLRYKNPSLPEQAGIELSGQPIQHGDFHHVIGRIRLQNLLAFSARHTTGAFIADISSLPADIMQRLSASPEQKNLQTA